MSDRARTISFPELQEAPGLQMATPPPWKAGKLKRRADGQLLREVIRGDQEPIQVVGPRASVDAELLTEAVNNYAQLVGGVAEALAVFRAASRVDAPTLPGLRTLVFRLEDVLRKAKVTS